MTAPKSEVNITVHFNWTENGLLAKTKNSITS